MKAVVQRLTVVDNSVLSPKPLTILHDPAYALFYTSHPSHFTS